MTRCYVCEQEIKEGQGLVGTRHGEAHYRCHAQMPYELVQLSRGVRQELVKHLRKEIEDILKTGSTQVPNWLKSAYNSVKDFP